MDGFTFGLMSANRGNVAAADAAMAEAQVMYDELKRELERTKRELTLQCARKEGLFAQAQVLYDALKAVDPNNAVLHETGRTYHKSRKREKLVNVAYDKAFDQHCKANGVAAPERLRDCAR